MPFSTSLCLLVNFKQWLASRLATARCQPAIQHMMKQKADHRLRNVTLTLAACLALTGCTLYFRVQPCCTHSGLSRQPLIRWILDNGGMVCDV